jgi:radical SAM superfamily enzyme
MIIQRLTADARYPWLVAPDWILQKNAVIRAIEKELAVQNDRDSGM